MGGKTATPTPNLVMKQSCHYNSIFECPWSELGSTGLCHSYWSGHKVCATTLLCTYCQKIAILLFGTRFFNQARVVCGILF